MGEMRRIEVEIDAAMLAAADDAVENGRFADRDAVIRHALSLWNDSDHDDFASLPQADQDRLRRLIEEGFASGDPVEDSDDFYEDVKARGRARLAARRPAA
jgi:antitoxin ParD1/3/4